MGHWLDALAKASTGHRARHRTSTSGTGASPEPGRPATAPADAQGLSRRALLRRGAVVGAAVWSTPVLQSAIAPAAAASGPCTVLCPVGSTCTSNANCATGLVCSGGVCLIPQGGSGCTGSGDCVSGNCMGGVCQAQWPGTSCSSGTQCLSGKCTGGTCFDNPLGAYCRTTADCTDNTTCPANGDPARVCGGPGASCQNNNKCVSRRCRSGVCD